MSSAHGQRRVGDIASIHLRNATLPHASTDGRSARRARSASPARDTQGDEDVPDCFVTLRTAGAPPFYVTSVAHRATNHSWGELASTPIRASRDFAPWASAAHVVHERRLLVALWARSSAGGSAWRDEPDIELGHTSRERMRRAPGHAHGADANAWHCVWETPVDLRSLDALPGGMAETYPFSSNTVVLGIQREPDPHAPFELPEPEYLEVRVAETSGRQTCTSLDQSDPEKRVIERSKAETSMRPSYTLEDIATLLQRQSALAEARKKVKELRSALSAALQTGDVQNAKSEMRTCAEWMRASLEERMREHSIAVERLSKRGEELQRRRAQLARARQDEEYMAQEHTETHQAVQHKRYVEAKQLQQRTLTERTRAAQVHRDVWRERARLLRELECIYPIHLVDARELLYSIVDIPLPNGVASSLPARKTDLEQAAAALGLVSQLVVLLSTYLTTNIPYPIYAVGSRAMIQDGISTMHGSRIFTLYGRGVEQYRYEYAVFLLNKDIEQLMSMHHIPMLDLRNMLPNLKNLLVTLASRTAP